MHVYVHACVCAPLRVRGKVRKPTCNLHVGLIPPAQPIPLTSGFARSTGRQLVAYAILHHLECFSGSALAAALQRRYNQQCSDQIRWDSIIVTFQDVIWQIQSDCAEFR